MTYYIIVDGKVDTKHFAQADAVQRADALHKAGYTGIEIAEVL